ncbi:c-type cytochrome [Rhodoplanes sp. SY1]|uniref:c-type cytochrome n=1 Tax=Rhodoplanes sp. SY1 TaxID=3166646 RepID=UPI0038B52E3F
MRTLIVAAVIVSTVVAATAFAVERTRERTERVARAITGGDPERAPELIRRYGCAGCHTIPGIPGADGVVGPSLAGLRQRVYVGGVARNAPDDLVRWIVSPQAVSPRSAMPATGIDEAEARHVAAYLYAQ